MYELRCPECGQIVAAPFVRVGAVVVCGKCRVAYPVREQDFKRRTALAMVEGLAPGGPGGAAGGSAVLLEEEEPHEKDPHDTDVTGLSGLSGLMKQEPRRAGGPGGAAGAGAGGAGAPPLASARPAATTGAAAAAAPAALSSAQVSQSVAASRQRAARQRHRRQTRTLAMMVIVGLGIVALAIVGLYVVHQRGLSQGLGKAEPVNVPAEAKPPQPTPPETGSQAGPPSDAGQGAPEPDPPTAHELLGPIDEQVAVTRLDSPYWRQFNPPVTLPEETDPELVIRRGRIITDAEGRRRYEAELVNESPTTVDRATLWVALVDPTMREAWAGVAVPLSMLEAYSTQPVAVAIPDYIVEPSIHVATRVSVQQEARLAVPLPMMRLQAQPTDDQVVLRIEARTPARGRHERMVFHATATDPAGKPMGQWRVEYPRPSDAGEQVTFVTRLTLTDPASGLQWTLQGYALD